MQVLIDYLQVMIARKDWHGVSDAANDLREMEAEMRSLEWKPNRDVEYDVVENADDVGIRCNEHPDAPHGFMRDASHSAGRYVCECESWEPPKEKQKPVAYITGFHNGHCVIQPTDPAVVLPAGMALYRAPTEWVGLKDEEMSEVVNRLQQQVEKPAE